MMRQDTAEYEEWRDERLELGVDPEGLNAQSLDLWQPGWSILVVDSGAYEHIDEER